MIAAGTRLTHARSGDDFIFLSEAEDWRTDCLKLRMHLTPGRTWAPRHYHTEYDETLSVESGRLTLVMNDARWTITPEDGVLLIPRGVVHAFWNEHDATTTIYAEIKPCFEMHRGVLAAYGMARDDTSSRWDLPYNPLQAGLLLSLLKSYSPWLPSSVQDAYAKSCSWLAKRLGHATDFPEHSAEHWPCSARAEYPSSSTQTELSCKTLQPL